VRKSALACSRTDEIRAQLYRPAEINDTNLIYGRNLTGERANWITLARRTEDPDPIAICRE
jgi:hypothetical protein